MHIHETLGQFARVRWGKIKQNKELKETKRSRSEMKSNKKWNDSRRSDERTKQKQTRHASVFRSESKGVWFRWHFADKENNVRARMAYNNINALLIFAIRLCDFHFARQPLSWVDRFYQHTTHSTTFDSVFIGLSIKEWMEIVIRRHACWSPFRLLWSRDNWT